MRGLCSGRLSENKSGGASQGGLFTPTRAQKKKLGEGASTSPLPFSSCSPTPRTCFLVCFTPEPRTARWHQSAPAPRCLCRCCIALAAGPELLDTSGQPRVSRCRRSRPSTRHPGLDSAACLRDNTQPLFAAQQAFPRPAHRDRTCQFPRWRAIVGAGTGRLTFSLV